MKKLIAAIFFLNVISNNISAQTWSTTGNAGTTPGTNFIGTTDAKDFVFKTNATEKGRVKSNGQWQFGATTNLSKIDSGGNLSFAGNAAYKVAGNKYAFQYSGNPNYGLFFNSTGLLYEFRTSTALSVFSVGANTGNGIFKGNLKIGAYTLPATDGTSGQVLQTNGTGTVTWQTVSGGSGANTSLSNLATTSINQSLLAGTDNSIDLGSGIKQWRDGFFGGKIYLDNSTFISNSGTANTWLGSSAGFYWTTGANNVGVGSNALYLNSDGAYNTAIGSNALSTNSSGNSNTAVGYSALSANSLGISNCAFGYGALGSSTTGEGNVAIGTSSLYSNSGGTQNIAVGQSAMGGATNSYRNIGIGISALSGTTGYSNVAIGTATMIASNAAHNCVAIGDSSLMNQGTAQNYDNTAVGSKTLISNTNGSANTVMGANAGHDNLSGTGNTFIGYVAGADNSTGGDNTAVGNSAGLYNTDGYGNTYLGIASGNQNAGGDYNTFLGAYSGYNAGALNVNYSTAIGYKSKVTQDNTVIIGSVYDAGNSIPQAKVGIGTTAPQELFTVYANTSGMGTAIYGVSNVSSGNGVIAECNLSTAAYGIWGKSTSGYAGYFSGNVNVTGVFTNPSDEKLKENIQPMNNALEKISALNPKTYTFKPEYAKMNLPEGTQNGFIAQEVEKVLPELVVTNYDKSMDEKNPMEYKSINYIGMIPVITEAIKEQQTQIDELHSSFQTSDSIEAFKQLVAEQKLQIEDLNLKIDAMMNKMNSFENSLSQCCSSYQSTGASTPPLWKGRDGLLEQNVPNPFNQSSFIKYFAPSASHQIEIVVSDLNGHVIKTFSNLNNGFGTVTISAGTFAAGTYQYTLFIDGNKIDTKEMILAR